MNTALDPVSAVTRADPYPFYAELRARGGFEFDTGLRLWVACSAQAVSEVLADPACRVRPVREPVPAPLVGTPAGEVFARLMRMNDGPAHDAPRRAAAPVLAALDVATLRSQAERCAMELLPRVSTSDWMHSLSARVLGTLLGCADGELDRLAQDVGRFVAALSPLATPEQRDAGNAAVLDLLLFVRRMQGAGVVAELHRSAVDSGWDDDMVLAANAVGLFSQAYEATAGW